MLWQPGQLSYSQDKLEIQAENLRKMFLAMAKDIRTAVFKVAQMKCENCVRKINNNIRFEKGLKDFHTDLKTKTVTITYDADKTNVEKLKEGFQKFHYEAEFVKETKQDDKK